ncbi:hypothetical protein [Candidatus Parabeggiatoa sp. HSG14]|uniref:hypothetical protein n=1 Tax=Candidatus Parabeggiatoa sp. HSG14 TaxID=3055593 RepID=UPI0025A857B3|nr:hypothetical protein [Thiotrichales bacterium HSG14]
MKKSTEEATPKSHKPTKVTHTSTTTRPLLGVKSVAGLKATSGIRAGFAIAC